MAENKRVFLSADQVQIYPSANSDDGGDINSEKNLSRISQDLLSKNFVVLDSYQQEDDPPMTVIMNGQNSLKVTPGHTVLEGRHIEIKEEFIVSLTVNSYCEGSISEWVSLFGNNSNYADIYSELYNEDGTKKKLSDRTRKVYQLELDKYALYLTLSLYKDATGNVRGDATERNIDPPYNLYRVCKGVGLMFKRKADLSSIDLPIAQIIFKPVSESESGSILIEVVDANNNIYPNKYSWINDSHIFMEDDGTALKEFILSQFEDLNTLTYYDNEGYKALTFTLTRDASAEDGNRVEVVRWEHQVIDGKVIYTKSKDANKSYNLDLLNKRSHLASPSTGSHIDEYDPLTQEEYRYLSNGEDKGGKYECFPAKEAGYYFEVSNTYNGRSHFVARADHSHDERYLNLMKFTNISKEDISDRKTQTIHTHVQFLHDIKGGDNPEILQQITGFQVWGAVWNDYAELYLKDDPKEVIEPGTIICKIRDKDTYSRSTRGTQSMVVGVCSDSYGNLLGGDPSKSLEENLKEYIPVALAGRVNVKVTPGIKISEGTLLCADNTCDGCARNIEIYQPGIVIGKALESTDGTKDKILMQVMLG